jgi:hypothetical protein
MPLIRVEPRIKRILDLERDINKLPSHSKAIEELYMQKNKFNTERTKRLIRRL